MKIKINEFWLCEDGELAPNSLRVNGRRQIQTAALLRAAAGSVFNRGNSVTTITFSVIRKHDSILEAEGYMLRHEVEIPQEGKVTFICYDSAGAEEIYYFDCGGLETTDASYCGCSTEHSYVLIGGRITTEAPV
ncbi:MAG: hypothetical protein WC130_12405 [Kiritimatiellia bacterium]|jgi:hypothetical protein